MELVYNILIFLSDFRVAFIVLVELAILPVSTALIYKKQFDGVSSSESYGKKRLNSVLFGAVIYAVTIITFSLSIYLYYLYIMYY